MSACACTLIYLDSLGVTTYRPLQHVTVLGHDSETAISDCVDVHIGCLSVGDIRRYIYKEY